LFSLKTKSDSKLEAHPRRKAPGIAELNNWFRDYKWRAKRKNIHFSLTKEEFAFLTSKPCYYCGAEPEFKKRDKGGAFMLALNGLDRINNAFGYIFGNLVPCCKICNFMKRTLSLKEFKNQVERIHLHWSQEGS
jgi:hypothetical protein